MSTALERPQDLDAALALLAAEGAVPLAGGSDLVPRLQRGVAGARVLVDLRDALPSQVERDGTGLRIGAGATLAALAADDVVGAGYAALSQAAASAASPQLRNVGTLGGNLAQHVRCWYYRHPDLTCWLGGGETCYAQIGDHRRHALEPGDCISVAPSDLAAALVALGATAEVRSSTGAREVELTRLYARPTHDRRSSLDIGPGELLVSIRLPEPPDASAYVRAGDRAAWSFAVVGVAAARRGAERTLAAIGIANEPRLLDPERPLEGLDGLPQTAWKRTLLATLGARALDAVA